jgi:ABC-type sulfate transport system permease subunit
MTIRRTTPTWVRWVGFTSALLVLSLFLLFPRYTLGDSPTHKGLLVYLGVIVLPACIAALLSFTRLITLLILPGIWYVILATGVRYEESPPVWSVFLFLGALTMLVVPIVGWAVGKKSGVESDTGRKQPENEKQ